MSDKTVKGTKKLTSANTQTNATVFLIEQTIRDTVNTAEVMRIDSADQTGSGGGASNAVATPLVSQTDAFDNALPTTAINSLPVFRYQAGKAAIIINPQPGDKALAVFTKRDSSNVRSGNNDSVQPASFRSFDQADGFLLNGFLGETPEFWLEIDPETGDIDLSTKSAKINIECRESGDINVKTGQGNVTIQAGNNGEGTITLDGRVVVTRTLAVQNKNNEEASQFKGGFENEGGVIKSNGVTLETHGHGGVVPGSGNSGSPIGGT